MSRAAQSMTCAIISPAGNISCRGWGDGFIGFGRDHLCGWRRSIHCLPRGGKTHRFVGTELEPYVAVAFCAAVALGFTLMLSGIIALMEER
jgi:hypothetical protein